ncbi:RDD family protein [Corynebacterium sp. TAE3-ERU30]|uniref:RDD family protein n=1 Tax=Corynebacterium sp. TAE3-ERU30 TaxID=2849496 RepID=UPI001C47FAAF|nr:RDD family protein [Corynebacterium sp. TAE3-ERU30]
MNYQHIVAEPVVDIYRLLDLDHDAERALVRLCTIDAELELEGLAEEQSPRREVRILMEIMDDADTQREYDEKALGQPCSWAELDTLAKLGELPDDLGTRTHFGSQAAMPPQPGPGVTTAGPAGVPGMPNMSSPTYGVAPQSPQQPVPAQGYSTGGPEERRPGQGTRFILGVGDWFVAQLCAQAILGVLGYPDSDTLVSVLITLVVMLVYVCGSEALLGGTPAKLAAGYRTKDVRTGKNLSLGQSLRRSWWKFFACFSGGQVISIVAGAYYKYTITEQRGYVGKHDEFVHGEVVRKRFVEDN